MSPQEALIMLRAETGLTQIEMAEKLNIGFVTLNRWENGKSFPNRANANNIIRAAREMGASESCLNYLNDVLLPSRMRGRPATALGFPALEQELLCQMIDGSAAGVVVIDEQTKRIKYVNRRAEELAGARFFDADNRHCWNYLKGLDEPCADCNSKRFPLGSYSEGFDTTPDGRKLRNRTTSIIWKGKRVYVVYMVDSTELAESKKEVGMLTSMFPAGAGVFNVYSDGRIELVDAFYQELHTPRELAKRYTGPKNLDSVFGDDAPPLVAEIQSAIAENRDINIRFRVVSTGRWVQLYARQFYSDDEKRSFYCSFVDVDRHTKEMQAENDGQRKTS